MMSGALTRSIVSTRCRHGARESVAQATSVHVGVSAVRFDFPVGLDCSHAVDTGQAVEVRLSDRPRHHAKNVVSFDDVEASGGQLVEDRLGLDVEHHVYCDYRLIGHSIDSRGPGSDYDEETVEHRPAPTSTADAARP
jgi:hypothetical protein